MRARSRSDSSERRTGSTLVLFAIMLVVILGTVAFVADYGYLVVNRAQLQNAADAASLAASQEIQAAVHAAGQGVGSATIDANSIAVQSAREMAADIAAANGVHIDPDTDVAFGKRIYNPADGSWSVQWGGAPYNVVKVTARRNGPDTSAPDGELKLAFGWAVGLLLAAALIRGLVQPAVKLGLAGWPHPFAATLIGYIMSATVILTAGVTREGRAIVPHGPGWQWFVPVGLLNGLSVLLMYAALARGPVTLVAPLVACYPLATLAFGRLLLGAGSLTWTVALGVATTVAGVALLLRA